MKRIIMMEGWTLIPDEKIPTTDPETLITEYERLVFSITNRYRNLVKNYPFVDLEDLEQTGRLSLLIAQQKYKPGEGSSFESFAYFWIRHLIQRSLKFDRNGKAPPVPLSLDAPTVNEYEPCTLADIVTDENAPNAEETVIDSVMRKDVLAAVKQLPRKYRIAVTRFYLDEVPTEQILEEMNCSKWHFYTAKKTALRKLLHMDIIREYRPDFHTGPTAFQNTHTSDVERAILWTEKEYDSIYGEGAYLAAEKPENASDDSGESSQGKHLERVRTPVTAPDDHAHAQLGTRFPSAIDILSPKTRF